MEELFELFYNCSGVSTDTRTLKENELFIALNGENFNGNIYAEQAINKGAKYAIVDEKKYADSIAIFYTEDCLEFLQKLANHHRNKFSTPIIGITGSNGKTTTKELIAAVLNEKYNVLSTQGNLNNHIGVPLTLLQLNVNHEIAIIEMGASKIGDIKELTDIAQPTTGLITNIGTAHIEGFGSEENIIKTKTELYTALAKVKGHIFCPVDDNLLFRLLPSQCTYSTYSTYVNADIKGRIINKNTLIQMEWETNQYISPTIATQLIGDYNLKNILAAISVGEYFSVEKEKINHAIATYTPGNNRSQFYSTNSNELILDAYNANPTSVRAALQNFSEINAENKFFILGDMLELGENEEEYHTEIVNLVKSLGLQGIFVGECYQKIAKKNEILAFESRDKVISFLQNAVPANNLILIKGSRGIGLEKLINFL